MRVMNLGFDIDRAIGANATTYILLAATGSLRWSATGTVYSGTDTHIEAGGDVYLTAGNIVLSFGGDVVTFLDAADTDSLTFAVGHEGYIHCDVGGATRYIAFRETV